MATPTGEKACIPDNNQTGRAVHRERCIWMVLVVQCIGTVLVVRCIGTVLVVRCRREIKRNRIVQNGNAIPYKDAAADDYCKHCHKC